MITYPDIAEPPLLAGAAHVTNTCWLPAEASSVVGAAARVRGVKEAVGDEVSDVPNSFVAVTAKV